MRKFSVFFLVLGLSCGGIGGGALLQTASGQTTSQYEPSPQQTNNRQIDLANLRADIQVLDRRMREMTIAMEDLMLRNRQLTADLEQMKRQSSQPTDSVRNAQLDQAVANLRQQIQTANADQRRQIIKEVTQQIEALADQTQAAIDALARNVSSRPSTPATRPTFTDDFPKEGISYTVKSGDTLSGIASRHNATVHDIQNANQITNPAAIQVGQTLFIPQRN